MRAEDAGKRGGHAVDLRLLLAGNACLGKLLQRGPDDRPGGIKDKKRHDDGADRVDKTQFREETGQRNGKRGGNRADGVAPVMPGVGLHRARMQGYGFRTGPAKQHFLGNNGKGGNRERESGGPVFRTMAERADSIPGQSDGNGGKRDADERRNERLDAGVSVRMLPIGRRGPVFHTENYGQVGHEVGQAVHGIGEQGLTMEKHPAHGLGYGQEDVQYHSHDRDKPHGMDRLCIMFRFRRHRQI